MGGVNSVTGLIFCQTRFMGRTQWAAAALLALFAGRALHAAAVKSATYDEAFNIAIGTAVLKAGDWRLRLTKPTLSMTLQALPHLVSGCVSPASTRPGGPTTCGRSACICCIATGSPPAASCCYPAASPWRWLSGWAGSCS